MKLTLKIITLALIMTVVSVVHDNRANAEPVSGFNAGNIISDSIFTNNTSMSVQQIQDFLNSKVPVCDTNGTQASEFGGGTRAQYGASKNSPAPFVCLKNYSENGKSSAQIIYDAAQEFKINPQIILVLLQKEQGLVTDTWPLSIQYKTATGYGCPDTAACDSQYFGLTNQIRWSSRMFRAIINNSPTWYTPYVLGNNYIQWNPNSSCGGSNVNIQNRSTQALYNYTPYQPNDAALQAGFGTGNSCSSYGNRNFYLYFTQWFGTTTGVTSEPNAVWRLYNPYTGGHILTASAIEATQYLTQGWKNDGVVMHTPTSGGVPVYRLWNGTYHYFTSSISDRDNYVRAGWKNDGEVFKMSSSGMPVWQLWNGRSHFQTSNSQELETYLKAGWTNDGIIFYESTNEVAPVWRLYNPYTGGHLLTSDAKELTTYLSAGWKNDGVVMHSDPNGIPVYRLWNGRTHFFTVNASERDDYIKAGWKNDGEIFKTATIGTPVYRLWSGSSHFYTSDSKERDTYIKAGWKNDGISFYTSDLIGVRRLYSPQTGSHLLTASSSQLWDRLKSGWTDDGIVFNASTTYGSPVYQLYNSGTDSYLYTTQTTERSAYASAGWRDDGIVFYGTPNGNPVYRLYNTVNRTHIVVATQQERSAYVSAGWVDDGIVFNGR